MSIFLRYDCLTHNETARKAMESYAGVLQEAFELHRKLWENYVKLQEKCEKRDGHLSSETDQFCEEIKVESASQEIVGVSVLKSDTSNMSSISINSDEGNGFSSPSKSHSKIIANRSPPKSPVFSRAYQKTGGARKLMQSFKAVLSERNNSSSDMKPRRSPEETSANCKSTLKISTSHHVRTTILPNGKKLKQSRLVFHPAKCNEKKVSNTNKQVSKLPKTDENFTNNISAEKAIVTLKSDAPNANEIVEDVIEISPTQRDISSRVKSRLKLKRKAPAKETRCSPRKNNFDSSAVPEMTKADINFACPLQKSTCAQMEDGEDDTKIIFIDDPLKDKINRNDFAKMHSDSHFLTAKSVKIEKESQKSEINNVKSIGTNNFEDETFYLPAEQAANENNINSQDAENNPPVILVKDTRRMKDDISEQLNMRCKADRARLDGWDCWECKQYYKNLSLSKEELQKRRNQCSRHRHKYERPNTPEGFWDPDFPETLSFTYRQNQN